MSQVEAVGHVKTGCWRRDISRTELRPSRPVKGLPKDSETGNEKCSALFGNVSVLLL